MTYRKRELEVEFTLSEGTFDQAQGNILTLRNMKCEVSISAFGGVTGTTMEMSLWGLSLDHMAKLTVKAQRYIGQKQNLVKLKANGETIFLGTIVASRINLNQMPDAPIEITANVLGYERILPCSDTVVRGVADVGSLVMAICNKVGLSFVNVDVNKRELNPHYPGNAIKQITDIAANHKFNFEVDIGVATIYTGKDPIDGVVPFVSPSRGLIGYPIFYDQGILFRCLYSSSIKVGRKLILDTSLPNGSGEYIILAGTTHYLSSMVEGGPWETSVVAQPLNYM
ncbi:baseplate hub protein [Winslowiella toletana]|uniref:baseplate hub protein n=1 Tax=Winslowiella toletana TaxID=92490 RepID=UPI0028BE8632|nr:hypothetical protein [Winslowiella toletana]WNN42786.1 hypothetical protein RIN69_13795 [Winslowiella toletana]